MIDIHCHILPLVDDGSTSIDESILLLKKMVDIGFSDIILTPHYIEDSSYCINNKDKIDIFNKLKDEIKKQNIDINIYLGNEIFISNNILDLIKNKEILPLNNTKYLLLELPINNKINNLDDILYKIIKNGYIPIIAHPERCNYFKEDKDKIDKLYKDGILFQINYSSILGYNGRKAKSIVKYMLKKRYVSFLSTDIHSINSTYVIDNYSKIKSKIKSKIIKYSSSEYLDEILNNGRKIISK